MASCRRVLFLVTQDHKDRCLFPMNSLNKETNEDSEINTLKKEKKRKETVINYHLLCTCAGVR